MAKNPESFLRFVLRAVVVAAALIVNFLVVVALVFSTSSPKGGTSDAVRRAHTATHARS